MTAIAIDFRIALNRRAAANLTRHIADARTVAERHPIIGPTREREAKGDIESVEQAGRRTKRVRAGGSIHELVKSGSLTSDHAGAAEHYQAAYEAVHSSGRSKDIPRPGSGVQAARTTITDAHADASQTLKRLDRIVGPQCLRIVQLVAGEGQSIRDCYKGGKSRKLASARLRIGLGRLARWLGTSRAM